MGVARHFNGSGDNLSTTNSFTTYTNFTFCAWVKRDSAGATRNGLAGRLFAADNGWAVFLNEGNQWVFKHDAVEDFVSSPDLSEWTFLGVTFTSSGGNSTTKFYAGRSRDEIALLGTTNNAVGQFGEIGTAGINVGWIANGPSISVSAWNGDLDEVRILTICATLIQLKEAAICGAEFGSFTKLYVPISELIAANPEPCIFNNAADFVYPTGTTVITGFPVGCDFAVPPEEDSSSGSSPIVDEDFGELRVTQVRKWYAWLITPEIPTAACTFVPVVRILRASDFLPIMELDLYATLRYTRRWTDLDDFELKLSCDTEQGLTLAQILKPSASLPQAPVPQNGKYLVAVAFNQLIDFVGFIDRIKCFKGGGRHEMTLSGYGLDRIFSDRVLAPAESAEFDAYDDPVETIIKTMLDRHIKNPGTFTTSIPSFDESQREVPPLLIATDNERGPTIVYNGRFQRLIDGVRDVIQAAAGELGYTLQLINGTLLFDVVPGNDRSLEVVFSPDYDNVSEFEWEDDGLNFSSHVVMGGQGTGATKLLQAVRTPDSERFNIERRESYLDASDAETTTKLQDKGKAFLQDKGRVSIYRIKKLPGSRPCYKEDWDLGDFVGLRDRQYGINDRRRVEEVTVSLAAGQVTGFDLVLAKSNPIGPLTQLAALRQGATGAVARQ